MTATSSSATAAVAARLRNIVAQGAAAALVRTGRRRGWFAALSKSGPITAAELAVAVGADAGVVGDWLDGLVLARLVDHDGARSTYALPAAVAAALDDADALFDCDAARDAIAAAARSVCGDAGAVVVNAGEPIPRGMTIVVVDVDAALRVADNLEHPLGPALYARSLHRREHAAAGVGVGGVGGVERLRQLGVVAGVNDARIERAVVGGMPYAFLIGHT